jgi:RNA polymerase sigma-70 factor, ECF subfamily
VDPGGTVTDFGEYRPLMFSIAYRMTGSVSDAEDIVQEAFLRITRALRDGTKIESPKAFVATVTTRLAITHQTSARVRRESYVGAWLPEPLIVDEHDPADRVEMADSLSMAFLLMLETLTPTERAVFLLHEVFAYDYKEIADVVGKSEPNCRQILTRSRRRLHEQPRFESSREQGEQVAQRFLAAVEGGDLDGLLALLAPDATMTGDGGGKAMALASELSGSERIARFLLGLMRRFGKLGTVFELTPVNGGPGAISYDAEHRVIGVFSLDIADGKVQNIRSIVNPDKLGHLGPVSDLALPPSRGLPCPAWRTLIRTRSAPRRFSRASRTPPIRGCANCSTPWSGTCTPSFARRSPRSRSGNTR